ncbi:helix-turn-helix transcriptional regulator [Niveibacterium sp. SC-1]|uniref:helix-turn-helix transcriptional regulator n=1 Tax=Niveibacterium sp. SC-1 TaxID=3135646 RepID=UPI00311FC145
MRLVDLPVDEVRFGRVVRDLRSERGWSQERLAEHADLNRTYLGEIERGRVIPSLVSASKIASAFGLRLSVLIASCEDAARGAGRHEA